MKYGYLHDNNCDTMQAKYMPYHKKTTCCIKLGTCYVNIANKKTKNIIEKRKKKNSKSKTSICLEKKSLMILANLQKHVRKIHFK